MIRTNAQPRAHLRDRRACRCSPWPRAGRRPAGGGPPPTGALVGHLALDALGHQLVGRGLLLEVAVGRAARHRAERAHAAVGLEAAALVEDHLARRLVGARRASSRPSRRRRRRAIALAKSPEYLMPPSAMTGTPSRRAASAQSMIAVSCGTPTPATIRVVQIEPGPMPTFTASAPGRDQRRASPRRSPRCRRRSGRVRSMGLDPLDRRRRRPSEWPCAVSITTRSTPASISATDRSKPGIAHGRGRGDAQPAQLVLAGLRVQHRLLGVLQRQEPGQPPARRRPAASRSAAPSSGSWPRRGPPARAAWRGCRPSSSPATGVVSSLAKRMSRLVTMPEHHAPLVDHRKAGDRGSAPAAPWRRPASGRGVSVIGA